MVLATFCGAGTLSEHFKPRVYTMTIFNSKVPKVEKPFGVQLKFNGAPKQSIIGALPRNGPSKPITEDTEKVNTFFATVGRNLAAQL